MCISSPKNGWCNVPKREKKMLFFDYIVAGTQRCQTWLGICTDSSYGSESDIKFGSEFHDSEYRIYQK
jgi:hypothetical protein